MLYCIIGVLLAALFIIGVTIFCTKLIGFKLTLAVYAGTAAIVGLVNLIVWLLEYCSSC
jgi:hypothetical protein